MNPPVFIIGRYPPPIDGQSMLTEQSAKLLSPSWDVKRLNTSAGSQAKVRTGSGLSLGMARHYLTRVASALSVVAESPDTPVIWHSISPTLSGHLRDLCVVLPSLRAAKRVYAVIHWGNFDRLFRSRLTRYTALRMVKKLQGFVFNDEQLSRNCEEWIPADKRFVICNTIDEATRCTRDDVKIKQALRADRKSLRLLYLSNMIPSKGYLDVLQAVAQLNKAGMPLSVDFIGRWQSEQEQSSFLSYVSDNHLEQFVTAHGGVTDRAAVRQFFLNADVFLLPTYYPAEAQPVSIIEALSAGTPVITTRHAGIPLMVREEFREALFVSPKSPTEIAGALQKLWEKDTWKNFSDAAASRFEERFSPEVVRGCWERLLRADRV